MRQRWALSWAGVLLLASPVGAAPLGVDNITVLINKSSDIVLGKFSVISFDPKTWYMVSKLDLVYSFKGGLSSGSNQVKVFGGYMPMIGVDQLGIMFLKKSDDGTYAFINNGNAFLPIVLPPNFSGSGANTSLADEILSLEDYTLKNGPPEMVLYILNLLDAEIQTDTLPVAVNDLANSANGTIRAEAIFVLALHGKLKSADGAIEAILASKDITSHESQLLIGSLQFAPPPKDAKAVLQVAVSIKDPDEMLDFVQGLRQWGLPATVPFLLQQLDSSDQEIQYSAMMALSNIFQPTQDKWDYAHAIFQKNPAEYINRCKAYAAQYRVE